MAKRNKAKSLGRKSALRVEALEQRQLLAAITGGGTEVGTDIQHPNGNVYDQVLMTGASVTVTADAGQTTRVSFVDLQGDILQAEFSGAGTLTISLDQFQAAAEAAKYNQPGVEYVGGLASFTIQGSDATTNFSVFSVGSANAVNQGLFDDTHTGGNNTADVARLTIVANPQNPLGSTFGNIYAGNAVFSADTGLVGIGAANVAVQGVVRIGDIDASNTGVATLNFGGNSQFGTLQVAGGDLAQSNGQAINNAGFTAVNFTGGATSAGDLLAAQVVGNGVFQTAPQLNQTLDAMTTYDLTGKTQTDLNNTFNGRTFTGNLTITGDLAAGRTITAASFNGLTFTGNVAGTVLANSINSLNLTNLSGVVSTDVNADNNVNAGEGSIGTVAISGNIAAGGQIESSGNIGNITVGGNIQGGAVAGIAGLSGVFVANGNVGSLTVAGDVSLAAAANNLIAINKGVFGNVSIEGGGTLGNLTSANNLGRIVINDVLDGIALGSYTAVDNADVDFGGINTDLDNDDSGTATLGAVSVSVSGMGGTNNVNRADVTLSGQIGDAGTTAVTSVSLTSDSGNVTTAAAINGTSVGPVNLTASGNTSVVTLGGEIGNGTVAVGAVTISSGQNVAINQDVVGGAIGAYSVTAGTAANTTGTITFADDKGIAATGNIASVTLTANGAISLDASSGASISGLNIGDVWIGGAAKSQTITFASDTASDVAILATGAGVNAIGNVTLHGIVVGGTADYEIAAAKVGNVTIEGATNKDNANDAVVTNFGVGAIATRAGAADANETVNANGNNLTSWTIGDVTVNQTYNTSGSNAAAQDALFAGDNRFVATGTIGDIVLTASVNNNQAGKLFAAAGDSAVFVVGDADGDISEAATDVAFTAGSVGVGNIAITAAGTSTTIDGIGGGTDAAGFQGFTVLAGVRVDSADAAAVNNATSAGLVAGNIPVEIGSGTFAGTVGNVTIKNTSGGALAVNQAVPVALSTFTAGGTNDLEFGGIFAATSVGTLQGTTVAVNTQASGVLIGPSTNAELTSGNLLVYVV